MTCNAAVDLLSECCRVTQVGNVGLTLTEQYTHMTLWCISGAPLLAGTDLIHASNETLAILANKEVTGRIVILSRFACCPSR